MSTCDNILWCFLVKWVIIVEMHLFVDGIVLLNRKQQGLKQYKQMLYAHS